MATYHPPEFSWFPKLTSGAFPLTQEIAVKPTGAWQATLTSLVIPDREITQTLTMPSWDGCPGSEVVEGNYQGYYQTSPYRGFFLVSGLVHVRVIGPVVEHFPPGADTWPDDIKPQLRVPFRMQEPYIEPAPVCPQPVVDDEDSRTDRSDWPVFKHAYPKLKGLDLWTRPGQPAIAASVVAKVKGATAVVDTGSVTVISSIVVGSKGLKFDVPISNLLKQVRLEGLPLQIRISRSDPKANFEIAEFKNAMARLSGVEIVVRSGNVTGLVGPDLQVEEDEELLFLLEVA